MPALDGVVRRAPFALYGLSSAWTGDRRAHCASTGLGEVLLVGLRHGSGGHGDPELIVSTIFAAEGRPEGAPFTAALHLDTDRPDDEGGGDRSDPVERIVARHRGRWRPVRLPVEGRDQVFWFQEAGDRWAAFARVGPVRVVVAATRWARDDVQLVVVERERYVGSTTSR